MVRKRQVAELMRQRMCCIGKFAFEPAIHVDKVAAAAVAGAKGELAAGTLVEGLWVRS